MLLYNLPIKQKDSTAECYFNIYNYENWKSKVV